MSEPSEAVTVETSQPDKGVEKLYNKKSKPLGPDDDWSSACDLPIAPIYRIVRRSVPQNILISKDAKQAFARAAGIFILYLSSSANDFCKAKKRCTISSTDVMAAVEETEFEEFLPTLQKFLDYRHKQKEKKNKKKAEENNQKKRKELEEKGNDANDGDDDKGKEEESPTKKVKPNDD